MTVIGGGGGRIQFRREAGGYLHNSIFVDSGNGQLEIEPTSANMQEAGLLRIGNNIWCADSSLQDGGTAVFDGTAPWGANNVSANPFLGGMNYYMNLTIKQRNEVDGVPLIPDATAEVVLNLAPYYGHFLDPVKFKGAFDPATEAWTKGWTVGSALGYFIEYPSVGTNFADTDSDGLNDYLEVAYGADPNLADTSGDGLNDGVVVNAGFDPTVNYSNLANPFRDGMIDLRPGSTMITVENGEAILSMELEKSDDLEIWTSGGTTDLQIPLDNDTDTKFFRFKMAD
jgi:hypothetical protein